MFDMNRSLTLLLLAAALPTYAQTSAAQTSAEQRVRQADRYRSPVADMRLDVRVLAQPRDGGDAKEKHYTVFQQAGNKTLVLMRHPAEQGQKVLMLGDDFWIVLPNSARPMRITPMQKLLGDASVGDVSTLRWSDDYSATELGEEPVDGTPAVRLSLRANRKGVTYQRIELWVGKARSQPLKAELYVQSDKLAKSATFVFDDPAQPTQMTAMILTDALGNGRQTQVFYLNQQARVVPQAWLNPMFLANHASLDE
jgi:outer membrane lipoprotein-sorting protein